MGKELTISEVVEEANRQIINKIDGGFIAIVGCDSDCVSALLSNSRNNESNEKGRNRLSLKLFCSEKDYEHQCVYNILRDNEVGLGWVERISESSYNFRMTKKGISEIYGVIGANTDFPVMTIIQGSIYFDETHPDFLSLINQITTHPLFEDCGRYNDSLKSRKMVFSKNELELALELGINLGVKETTDETQND